MCDISVMRCVLLSAATSVQCPIWLLHPFFPRKVSQRASLSSPPSKPNQAGLCFEVLSALITLCMWVLQASGKQGRWSLSNRRLITSLTSRCLLCMPFLLQLHELLPVIMTCVVSRTLCARPEAEDHWSLRHEAGKLLAVMCRYLHVLLL